MKKKFTKSTLEKRLVEIVWPVKNFRLFLSKPIHTRQSKKVKPSGSLQKETLIWLETFAYWVEWKRFLCLGYHPLILVETIGSNAIFSICWVCSENTRVILSTFRKRTKVFLPLSLSLTLKSLVKIDLYKSCGSSFSGVDMPGHLFSSDPCFSLAVDQWPNPTTCTWFLSGIASRKLACSTKNCGFKCNYPHELKKHQEKCTDQVSIVARNRTYG